MKLAVLSDIHGNDIALDTCFWEEPCSCAGRRRDAATGRISRKNIGSWQYMNYSGNQTVKSLRVYSFGQGVCVWEI